MKHLFIYVRQDGMPLEPTPGKIEIEKTGSVHKLFIRSTSVHDEGEYTCQLGDEECSAEVTVIGKLQKSGLNDRASASYKVRDYLILHNFCSI